MVFSLPNYCGTLSKCLWNKHRSSRGGIPVRVYNYMTPEVAGVNVRGVWWVKAVPDGMEKVIYTVVHMVSFHAHHLSSYTAVIWCGLTKHFYGCIDTLKWSHVTLLLLVLPLFLLIWLCLHWMASFSVILSSATLAFFHKLDKAFSFTAS